MQIMKIKLVFLHIKAAIICRKTNQIRDYNLICKNMNWEYEWIDRGLK